MSGRINMENFEAFLLDHAEGNLSAEDTQELKTFLLLHPELDIDLDDLELPTLELPKTVFSEKDKLKRASEFSEEDILNYLEGQLSGTKLKAFEAELEGSETLRSELALYKKTQLVPENEIVFGDKTSLKRAEEDLVTGNPVLLYMEGLMTTSESAGFEKELGSDQHLSAELSAFRKTKMSADTSVVYANKEELKREARVFYLFTGRRIVAYAASILLIVGVFVLFRTFNEQITTPQGLAVKNGEAALKLNERSVHSTSVVVAGSNVAVNSDQSSTLLAGNSTRQENKSEPNTVRTETLTSVAVTPTVVATADTLSANAVAIAEPTLTAPSALPSHTVSSPVAESSSLQKQVLLAYEEDNDEEAVAQKKPGFWKRAVAVARQANNMGLKAVNGKEEAKENYLISFNSFSIEKK